MPIQQRTPEEVLEVYDRNVSTVYRVCRSFLREAAEAEDMTQETFLKLMTAAPAFESQRHERAWLIVTASNLCKNELKKWWRRHEDLADHLELAQPEDGPEGDILETVMSLPGDYKTVVYMFYYEGYTTGEIARFLHCPDSTVRNRLARGRKLLGNLLGGEAP